jgi:hypothetical protein
MNKQAMTKEEMTQAIQECAAKLGRIPTAQNLQEMVGITRSQIRKQLGSYKQFVETRGIEGRGSGHKTSLHALFLDWAGVVRKLGKIPSVTDYQLHGKYTYRPLQARYGRWPEVPAGMLEYARQKGIEGEWSDVEQVVSAHLEMKARQSLIASATSVANGVTGVVTDMVTDGAHVRHRTVPSQPIYGRPLLPCPLTYAPTCESGVIFLFGMLAERLGFAVQRIQTAFPDGEALRELSPNRWQRVRIEFEYESRHFLQHQHPVDGCDLIVCWSHNWLKCPLEVLELQSVILPQPPRIEYAASAVIGVQRRVRVVKGEARSHEKASRIP